MEVYGCLHDMISEMENKNNIDDNIDDNTSDESELHNQREIGSEEVKLPILKLRGNNGGLILIDRHGLKYNPRLEGAEVFKMLFKISDTNPYGDYPMITNKEGYVTLFQELRISPEFIGQSGKNGLFANTSILKRQKFRRRRRIVFVWCLHCFPFRSSLLHCFEDRDLKL